MSVTITVGAKPCLGHQLQRGLRVPPSLNKDVEHFAVLIHGAPEPEPFARDQNYHFVHAPGGTGPRPPAAEFAGEDWAELQRPPADRHVGNIKHALGEQVLNIAEAQRKLQVQPHGVLDDIGPKTVTVTLGAADRAV